RDALRCIREFDGPYRDVLRIPPVTERVGPAEDRVSPFEPFDQSPGRFHGACNVPSKGERQAVVRHLLHEPFADLPVDRVDPAGVHFDEHLVGTDLRFRCLLELQDPGIAEFMNTDRFHDTYPSFVPVITAGREKHLFRAIRPTAMVVRERQHGTAFPDGSPTPRFPAGTSLSAR